jgi:GDP-L-fucose synthase
VGTVGENEEVSIKEVADSIVKYIGFEGECTVCLSLLFSVLPKCKRSSSYLQFDTSKLDGQFRKPASNDKLLGLMGGFEFTPFQMGAFTYLVLMGFLLTLLALL